jgi:hypothetical protein
MAAKQPTGGLSLKRVGIDKTNSRILATMAISAFLTVFFLVASYMLFTQLTYQNRVIKEKKKAVAQLKENLTARDSLVSSYTTFAESGQNFIGGTSTGNGPKDGNNAKLVLDALPSTYDYPALTTSLEKVALDQKVKIGGIVGSDDQVNQQLKADSSAPIEMPFEVRLAGDYGAIQRLINAFDLSIRPIQFKSMKLSGDEKEVTANIIAQTFYQPEKKLDIKTKVVE